MELDTNSVVTILSIVVVNLASFSFLVGRFSSRIKNLENSTEVLFQYHNGNLEKHEVLHRLEGKLEMIISLYKPKD